MKNRLLALFSFTILSLNQGCSNNNQDSQKQLSPARYDANYHKIDFVSFIEKHKNDTLDFYEELLTNKEFVNVLEHGAFYKNDVNTFLKNGVFTNSQVAVCICAMQKLGVNDYVKLCNIVLSLYNNNQLSESLLEVAIDPDFLRKHIIAYHYDTRAVATLLKDIRNDKKVTNKDFRAWLPDMLSGKSAKELQQFEKDNYSH